MSESPAPFSALITQLSQDLATASELCEDIKKTRHVGKSHIQLDLLEESLLAGPSFLKLESTSFPDSVDEASRADLESCLSQIGEIIARLEQIAHPHRHHHSHHHRHHSHSRSLLFPDWDPVKHRGKEDPHFGDLRAAWEKMRGEIRELLGGVQGKGGGLEVVAKLEIKEEGKIEVREELKVETKVEVKEEVEAKVKEAETVVEKKEVAKVNVEEFLVESEENHARSEGKSEAVKA